MSGASKRRKESSFSFNTRSSTSYESAVAVTKTGVESDATPPRKRKQLVSITKPVSHSVDDTTDSFSKSCGSSSEGDSKNDQPNPQRKISELDISMDSSSDIPQAPRTRLRNAILRQRSGGTLQSAYTADCKILSPKHEGLLEEILMILSVIYSGLTVEHVRRFSFWFAKIKNLKIFGQWNTPDKIDNKWLISFLGRHYKLLNRIIKRNNPDDVLYFNEKIYDGFCKVRQSIMQNFYGDPEDRTWIYSRHIYALDEIVFTDGVDNITAFFCINAIGNSMPPFLIYPKGKVLTTDGIKDWATEAGSVDCEMFLKVLNHFQKYIRRTFDDTVLMVFDSHKIHTSFNVIEYGIKQNIKFLFLPAHGSKVLQPLTFVFESLESNLKEVCRTYADSVTISNIPGLLNLAYTLSFTIPNIIEGFNRSEIRGNSGCLRRRNDFFENHRVFADQHSVVNVSDFFNLPAKETFDSRLVDRYFVELVTFYQENKTSKREHSGSKKCVVYTNSTRGILFTIGVTTLATVNVISDLRVAVDPVTADNGEHEENVITLCCFQNEMQSSSYSFLIFPDIDHEFSMSSNSCEIKVQTTNDGRLNDKVCMSILELLQRRAESTLENPILLIFDGEIFPITSMMRHFCGTHGIKLLPVPPNTAQKLIPYNKSIFKSCKLRFRRQCETLLFNNGVISFDDVVTLYNNVRDMNNYCDFETTGIHPVNRDVLALEYLVTPSVIIPQYDEKIAEDFYRSLTLAYDQLNQNGGLSPDKIYVLGNTVLNAVHNSICSQKETADACFFVNALGQALPPYLIFHRLKFSNYFLYGGPQEISGMSSLEDARCEKVFLDMLSHFQKYVRGTPSNQILLIMDERSCCINENTIDFCQKNGLILLVIPFTIRKVVLPLERTVFKSLTYYYERAYMDYVTSKLIMVQYLDRPNCRYPHIDNIASLLNRAFRLSFLTSSIIKGFECTGIWPLQENILEQYVDRGLKTNKKWSNKEDNNKVKLYRVAEENATGKLDMDTTNLSKNIIELNEIFKNIDFTLTEEDIIKNASKKLFKCGTCKELFPTRAEMVEHKEIHEIEQIMGEPFYLF